MYAIRSYYGTLQVDVNDILPACKILFQGGPGGFQNTGIVHQYINPAET